MARRIIPTQRVSTTHDYTQRVLSVNRVTRVVKGGRRFRMRALVVLGDGQGLVGIGVAKGGDVATAISKAASVARKKMRQVVLVEPTTIPHQTEAKVGGSHILLKPARAGTGLIAGSVARSILEVAGFNNIYSKSLGHNNRLNMAYAVIAALDLLVAPQEWHLNKVADKLVPIKQ